MRALLLSAALCAALGSVSVACSGGDPTSCKAVAQHFDELVTREIDRSDDETMKTQARANLPPLRDAVLELCNDEEWSEAVRRCAIEARSAEELEDCDPKDETASEAPDEAPVEAPAEAPTKAPIEAPGEAPGEAAP